MIGDSLEADIYGAKIEHANDLDHTPREFKDEDIRRIKPDFSLRNLNELLPTLERISIALTMCIRSLGPRHRCDFK